MSTRAQRIEVSAKGFSYENSDHDPSQASYANTWQSGANGGFITLEGVESTNPSNCYITECGLNSLGQSNIIGIEYRRSSDGSNYTDWSALTLGSSGLLSFDDSFQFRIKFYSLGGNIRTVQLSPDKTTEIFEFSNFKESITIEEGGSGGGSGQDVSGENIYFQSIIMSSFSNMTHEGSSQALTITNVKSGQTPINVKYNETGRFNIELTIYSIQTPTVILRVARNSGIGVISLSPQINNNYKDYSLTASGVNTNTYTTSRHTVEVPGNIGQAGQTIMLIISYSGETRTYALTLQTNEPRWGQRTWNGAIENANYQTTGDINIQAYATQKNNVTVGFACENATVEPSSLTFSSLTLSNTTKNTYLKEDGTTVATATVKVALRSNTYNLTYNNCLFHSIATTGLTNGTDYELSSNNTIIKIATTTSNLQVKAQPSQGYQFNSSNPDTKLITGSTIFTAVPIDYSIQYDLNGGSVSPANPTSYNIETPTFILNIPTKNGFTFKGWTGSNGATAQTVVTINQGSIGNRTYTAVWEEQSTDPEYLTVSYIDRGTTYEDVTLVAGDRFGKRWQSNGSKAGQFQGLFWDKYYIVGWSLSGEHVSDQYSNLSAYINFDVYHQVTASDIATYGNNTLILYPVLLTKTRLIWCVGGNINLYSQLFNNDDNTQIKLRIPQHMTGWFTVTHRYISENNGSTIIDYSTQNLQYRANDSEHLKLTMYTPLSQVVDKVYDRNESYQVIANTSDGTLNLNAGKEVSIQTYSDNIHDTFWFYDYENNDYYKTHYNNKYIMIYKVDDNNLVLKYKTKVHVTRNGFATVPLFSYAQNVYPSSTVITKLYKENSQDNLITSVSGIDSISPSYTYYAEVALTFNNISEGIVANEIFCNGYNLVYNNNGTVRTQNFTYYGNPGWSLAPEFNNRDVTTYYSPYQLCNNNYYLIAKIKGFEPLKLISNRHESTWTENLVAYGFSVKDLLEYPIQLKGYVADTTSLNATVKVSDRDSGNVRTSYTLSSIGTNQYGLYVYDREMTGTATLGACGVSHIGPVVTQMDIPRYIGTNNTSNLYAEPLHLAMAVVPHTFLFYSNNFDSDWELIKETFYMDSDSIYFNNDTSLKSHSFTDLEGVYISFKFKNYGQQAHFIDSLIWEGLSNSSYATAYFMCVDANKWDIAQRKELFQSNPNVVTINGKDFAKEYSSEMKYFDNNSANDTRLTKIDSSYKVLLRSKQNTNTIATMTNSNLHVINDGNTYGDAIRPGYDFEVHDEEMIKEGIFKVISEI